MKPVIQLYALALDELPGYDKSINYWDEISEELKKKPIYEDDIKRYNRICNLKLQMVKELLFDNYINKLKEPVIKTRKIKNKYETPDISIEKLTDNLYIDLKITKKNNCENISVVCKLIDNKKTLYKYVTETDFNKTGITTAMIIRMIDYYNEKGINQELKIKLNNKAYIKEFNKAVISYRDFINNEIRNNNLVENAVDTNDIGIMNESLSLMGFKEILLKNKKITFV